MSLAVTAVVLVCLALVAGLLMAKKLDSIRGVWLTKPLASIAFVVVAVLVVRDWKLLHGLMLFGLMLCLLGDVLLIPERRDMFLGGLVAFLTGHLMYIAAFSQIVVLDRMLWLPLMLLAVVNLGLYRWLHHHISDLKLPVIAYMTVISCMVLAACGVYADVEQSQTGRLLVLAGAIGFYVSDLFVVREQFVGKSFFNPLLGLPLYYLSQLGLALSLGYLRA